MWIGLIIVGYLIGVVLLIRFFKAVHQWDEEIENMTTKSLKTDKHFVSKAA